MAGILAERVQGRETAQGSLLAEQIVYFRNNWWKEGLPQNWYELPGTGFSMRGQMDMLGRDGDVLRWVQQTEQDVRGFALEYLCEGLVFPIRYEERIVNGQRCLVAPLYGNKRLVDTISEAERGGAVKRAVSEKIEPFFLDASDGSIAVMLSPSGNSGMLDEQGNEIIFPDSQTYILQKRVEQTLGFAIRTDFAKREHTKFLEELKKKHGMNQEVPSENAPESEFVEAVARIIPLDGGISIKDVVDAMQGVRGSVNALKDRLWSEVYADLDRGDELWQFDKRVEAMIGEFRKYVSFGNLTRQELQEALATTILRIAKFLRGKNLLRTKDAMITAEWSSYSCSISFGAVLRDVQSIPGCAGGGTHNLVNSLTPRHSLTEEVMHCVTCRFCKEVVDAILTQDKIICPKCEKSADR